MTQCRAALEKGPRPFWSAVIHYRFAVDVAQPVDVTAISGAFALCGKNQRSVVSMAFGCVSRMKVQNQPQSGAESQHYKIAARLSDVETRLT